VFASDDATAAVTAAMTAADGGIDGLPPRRVSPHAASSMLEKGKRNKNRSKDIDILEFLFIKTRPPDKLHNGFVFVIQFRVGIRYVICQGGEF